MSWSSDWLYSLLLKRAGESFAKLVAEAEHRSIDPPKLLLAMEHQEWNKDWSRPSGDPVRVWSSVDDFSSLHDTKSYWPPREQNFSGGGIYRVPIFSFYIAQDRKQVLVADYFGPLYGRGGWWDVVGQGRTGQLKGYRQIWVS